MGMNLPFGFRSASLLALCVACGSQTVVPAGASSSGGKGGAGQGGGGAAQGGALALGGFSGTGGTEKVPWEYECSATGIGVDGVGPVAVLNEVCPYDYWAATHYDGAVAYETHAGYVGHLDFHACADGGARQIHLSAMLDGSGSFILTNASYIEANQVFELASGNIEVTVDGAVGELVIGNYDAVFGPAGGGGEPLLLSGDVRACHLPEQHLP